MRSFELRKMVFTALMMAFVCVGTMFIQIPISATNGYLNMGDGIIYFAAVLLGPVGGFLAGGIGSAMADVLNSYSHWALFTLIIKGSQGFMVGYLVKLSSGKIKQGFSMSLGALIMVVGYFLAGALLKGSFLVSLQSVPANIIQGIFGVILGMALVSVMHRMETLNLRTQN